MKYELNELIVREPLPCIFFFLLIVLESTIHYLGVITSFGWSYLQITKQETCFYKMVNFINVLQPTYPSEEHKILKTSLLFFPYVNSFIGLLSVGLVFLIESSTLKTKGLCKVLKLITKQLSENNWVARHSEQWKHNCCNLPIW